MLEHVGHLSMTIDPEVVHLVSRLLARRPPPRRAPTSGRSPDETACPARAGRVETASPVPVTTARRAGPHARRSDRLEATRVVCPVRDVLATFRSSSSRSGHERHTERPRTFPRAPPARAAATDPDLREGWSWRVTAPPARRPRPSSPSVSRPALAGGPSGPRFPDLSGLAGGLPGLGARGGRRGGDAAGLVTGRARTGTAPRPPGRPPSRPGSGPRTARRRPGPRAPRTTAAVPCRPTRASSPVSRAGHPSRHRSAATSTPAVACAPRRPPGVARHRCAAVWPSPRSPSAPWPPRATASPASTR